MRISVFFSLLIALSFSHVLVASNDEVIAVFENYRTAILNADAEVAYQLIDSNTKKYYKEMLETVLYAPAEETQSMSPLGTVFIVQSRHRIPTETLTAFDEETYFKYAVTHGWIGKHSVAGIELADIKINGDTATTKIKKGEQTAQFGFTFRKEAENWKIDLLSIIPMSDMAFNQVIKNSGLEEDEFIFTIIESLSGKKVKETVWNPPLEK